MEQRPRFQDLTTFAEEKANEYSSLYGQWYAERQAEPSRCATTLASDTAGHEVKVKCPHCVREGHVLLRCFKFNGLSVDERKDVVKKLNLCWRCLKDDHNLHSCHKRCATCGEEHSSLLHEQTKTKEASND